MLSEDVPIACTLGAGAYQERARWIADLNTRNLRSYRRDNLTLHLVYDADALAEVQDLVRREAACCAFLIFTVEHDATSVRLSVAAPENARIAADTLFQDFTATGASALAQTFGCC